MKQSQPAPAITWKDARTLHRLDKEYKRHRSGEALRRLDAFRDKLVDGELDSTYGHLNYFVKQEVKRESREEINELFLSGNVVTEDGKIEKFQKPIFYPALITVAVTAIALVLLYFQDKLAESILGTSLVEKIKNFPLAGKIGVGVIFALQLAKNIHNQRKEEYSELAASIKETILSVVEDATSTD